MNVKLFTVIACLLLITACGTFSQSAATPASPTLPTSPPTTPPPAPSASPSPAQPSAAPSVVINPPTAPAPTPAAPVALSGDGEKLQRMITVADARLTSYKYFYSDRRQGSGIKFPIVGDYQIKGDRIRIDITPVEELSARQANMGNTDASVYQPTLYGDDHYDQFFLNTATRKAYARCDNQLCKNRGGITPVSYEDFSRKTPLDWRKEIPLDTVDLIDSKQIQGQDITRVTYTADGTLITQWLEEYSMLPVQVDVGNEQEGYTIHFVNLAPNSVSDAVFAGVSI